LKNRTPVVAAPVVSEETVDVFVRVVESSRKCAIDVDAVLPFPVFLLSVVFGADEKDEHSLVCDDSELFGMLRKRISDLKKSGEEILLYKDCMFVDESADKMTLHELGVCGRTTIIAQFAQPSKTSGTITVLLPDKSSSICVAIVEGMRVGELKRRISSEQLPLNRLLLWADKRCLSRDELQIELFGKRYFLF
jgi:hypothetical protein